MKEKYILNPMTEHPDVGVRVEIYFNHKTYNIPGHRDGIWNGEKWMFRKVYTKDEYIDIPAHCCPRGWLGWDGQRSMYEEHKPNK